MTVSAGSKTPESSIVSPDPRRRPRRTGRRRSGSASVVVSSPVAQDRRGPRVRRSVRVVRRRLDDRFASVSGAGRVAPGDPAPVAATTPARTTASTTAAATNTARADPSPPIDRRETSVYPRFGSVLGRSVRSRVVRCRPVRGRDGFGVRGGLCLGNFLGGGRTDLGSPSPSPSSLPPRGDPDPPGRRLADRDLRVAEQVGDEGGETRSPRGSRRDRTTPPR